METTIKSTIVKLEDRMASQIMRNSEGNCLEKSSFVQLMQKVVGKIAMACR